MKSNTEVGTYIHIFWKCPKIENFWKEVKDKIIHLFTVYWQQMWTVLKGDIMLN